MGSLWERLKSRKFLIAIAGIIIFLLSEVFGLDLNVEATAGVLGSIIAYIVGEGIVDRGRAASEIQSEVAYWRSESDRLRQQFYDLEAKYEEVTNPPRVRFEGGAELPY